MRGLYFFNVGVAVLPLPAQSVCGLYSRIRLMEPVNGTADKENILEPFNLIIPRTRDWKSSRFNLEPFLFSNLGQHCFYVTNIRIYLALMWCFTIYGGGVRGPGEGGGGGTVNIREMEDASGFPHIILYDTNTI